MSIPTFNNREAMECFITQTWNYSLEDYLIYWDFIEHYYENDEETGVQYIPFRTEKEQILGYN